MGKLIRALVGLLVGLLVAFPLLLGPPAHATVALDRIGRTIEIGAPPGALAFLRDDAFLAAVTSGGSTRVVLFEPSERVERDLDFSATDLVLDPAGRALYAVGTRGGQLTLAAIDLTGEEEDVRVVPLDLKARFLEPVIDLGSNGVAVVADGASGALAILSGVLPREGFAPAMERGLFYDARGGISGVGVLGDADMIIVSERARPMVASLNGLGAVGSRLNLTRTSDPARPVVPSVIGVHASDGPYDIDAVLVADYTSETLGVARLDRDLETISIVATGRINVPIIPGSTIERDPLTGGGRTPVLLAANPDHSAIAVGNRFSRSVMLFARDGRVLERRGAVTVDEAPSALAVSPSGRRVLVAYPNSDAVTLLDLGGDEVPVPRLSAPPSPAITTALPATAFPALERSGDPAVRALQRALGTLGYAVGSVDGFAGPETVRALRAAEIDTGIEIDAEDPVAAVETLSREFGREVEALTGGAL